MLPIITGCSKDPVFPSKSPQSGPAALAASGIRVVAIRATDAMADLDSLPIKSSPERLRGSNDPFSIKVAVFERGVKVALFAVEKARAEEAIKMIDAACTFILLELYGI
jgi:hypothetical protein